MKQTRRLMSLLTVLILLLANVGGALAEAITYPLTDAVPLTLFNLCNAMPSNVEKAEDIPFWQGLIEKTGVDLTVQFPVSGSDNNQVFNLMLTDEELPHIIWKAFTASDGETLIEDGVIYDLTEYLPVYAPDYWAVINSVPYKTALRNITTSSGKQFGFPALRGGMFNLCYGGPVVRLDWLEECGLKEPVTVEDWETMLVAFKEKYNAKFGFTMGYFSWLGKGIASGVGAYGAFDATYYVDDNQKIQYAQAQDEWLESMKILRRWYEMGLIDPDVLTMDNNIMRSKVLNNEIGASFTAMSQITNWMADAEAAGTGARWGGVSYLREAEGEPTCMIPVAENLYQGSCAVITTSCSEEELIAALKLLNYGYTEEGNKYWNYGTEGVSYTVDADGNIAFTDLITKNDLGQGLAVDNYSGTSGAGIAIQNEHLVRLKNVPIASEAVEKWIDNTVAMEHWMPSLPLDAETSTEINDIVNAISTYTTETSYKYLTGEESLDNYDKFLETLDQMGLKHVLEVYQTAYDAYIAK